MMQQNPNQQQQQMMNAGGIDPNNIQQQQQMMPQQQQNYQSGGAVAAGAYMLDHNQAAAAAVGVQQQQRMMRSSMNQMRPNVMMQNRAQGNIMVVNVPNNTNMQMQQQQQQQPIRMNETEVRVLSMLPEDDRQRLIAMSEDQRKQWIRRFMMDMQQQQSKVQQQQQQMMKNVPGQWNSGMGPPDMQQQQVRFMNAAQQQQFMQQQRFMPQQRAQQMMMMQQQQQPQQPALYRMGPRTPAAVLAQQGYMNAAQFQPAAASPGSNFPSQQQAAMPAQVGHYGVGQQQSPGGPYAALARQQQQQQMQAACASEPSPLSMDGSSGNLPMVNAAGHAMQLQQQHEMSKEDTMYNEKIKELQVYLDFLKRWDKGDVQAGQVGQAKREKFIDILEGRTKVNYDILIRCERVLQAMQQQQPDNKAKNFQPFLDTVVESMAKCSSSSNAEILSQNLKKAASCVDFYEDLPESCRIKLISDEEMDHQEKLAKKRSKKSSIPLTLEREIAFLDRKFDVKIKKIDKEKSKEFITLICNIKDPKLPIVPPLLVTVCQDYPASSPEYTVDASEYNDSNAFLKSVKQKMTTNLQSYGLSSTMTSLLNNWESSVRQIECEI